MARPKNPRVVIKRPPKPEIKPKKKRAHGGRKPLLNDSMIKKIEELLSEGHYRCVVADSIGIRDETLCDWNNKGERDLKNGLKTSIYAKYTLALKRSLVAAEMRNINLINKAAKENKQWQAAAWYLERKQPSRWRMKQSVEHTGNVGLNINLESLTDEQLDAIAKGASPDSVGVKETKLP